MRRYVFFKSLFQKQVDDLRLIVRNLLVVETPIELKRMAGRTVACEANWSHVYPAVHHAVSLTTLRDCCCTNRSCVWPTPGVRRTMTIVARHLHPCVVGTHEVGLQMQVMVQPDLSLIDLASGKRGKFRMTVIEVGNGNRELRLSVPSLKLRMTLRAARLARRRQARRASVFQVARGAMRRESLTGMVHRAVVTGETSFVAHFLEESSSSSHMTNVALLRKDCVSLGERSAGIDFLAALNSLRQ